MSMNKQTVWLVTMLTLMVVLSAYYIVTGPVEPADQAMEKEDEMITDLGKIEVKTKPKGELDQEKSKDENKDSDKETSLDSNAGSDYFIGYNLQRSALRSKLAEEHMKVLTDPEASKEELKEAQAKLDQLTQVDKEESVLEELIRGEGFRDAVVITNDSHIDVIVQADELTSKQVVKLVSLVRKQMDVPSTQVSVAWRP